MAISEPKSSSQNWFHDVSQPDQLCKSDISRIVDQLAHVSCHRTSHLELQKCNHLLIVNITGVPGTVLSSYIQPLGVAHGIIHEETETRGGLA